MERAEPVLVVGAGMAGLAAALSFARAGFAVELLERAATLGETGAGLQLSPNALRVLDRLGLDAAVRRHAVAAQAVTLRDGRTGRVIAEIPVVSSDGTAYLSLHRADLQSALLDAVARDPAITLTLGAECVGAERDGDAAVLTFRAGKDADRAFRRRAEIVIAADGVRSAVARALGHGEAVASGDLAWRMTVRGTEACEPAARRGIEAWLGPGRHAVAYPVRSGRETNIVLIGPERDAGDDLDGSADKAALLARFGGWDPRLKGLIAAAGPATAWPLATADRRRSPSDPPGLLMIGDAAHAILPYAAQGAAMAIEDAFVAASAFRASHTIAEAVTLFERRAPRIARVRRRVAFHRLVYHLPFPLSSVRDLVLGLRPKEALARDLGWLYDWRPPSDKASPLITAESPIRPRAV